MLLAAEPPVEAVLVKGMPALALRHGTADVRVVQEGAVRTDRLQGFMADRAGRGH